MLKLDKKDLQILYELDKNARQPLSNIAKKVNLSRESILYRSKKYFEQGIIRNYLTIVNLAKFGYTIYKVCVKLHNINEEQEKAIISNLVTNSKIVWTSSCDGKYSLLFAIKSKSLVDFNDTLTEIRNKYHLFFKEMDIAPIVYGRHFYREYLIGKKGTTERRIFWGGEEEQVKLDETNLEILDNICKNPRITAVDIANKLSVSSDAVLQRIKNLEKSNVIQHYMLWPNVNKLKGNYYKVLVSLHNLTKEKEQKLHTFCQQHSNIVYIVTCLGPWQFEMDIEVENIEELREILREFMNNFSEIVSDYTSLNIYQEHKFRFFEK